MANYRRRRPKPRPYVDCTYCQPKPSKLKTKMAIKAYEIKEYYRDIGQISY